MEFVIIFLLVRVIGNAWDSKVDEYRATQNETRKQINKRFPNATRDRRDQMVRNANRRKAAGYGLYQLRHGLPSLWTAGIDGWADARKGHEEWMARQIEEGRQPKLRDAAREAWRGRTRPVHDDAGEPAAKPRQRTQNPCADCGAVPATWRISAEPPRFQCPACLKGAAVGHPRPVLEPALPSYENPEPASDGDARVFPFKPPTINTTPSGDAVEAPNIEAARQAAANEATQLGARVSGWEQLTADLIAGGMGKDRQTMALAAQVQEHLANAQAAAAAFVASLNKHAGGEEYAATGHAAKTEFLQPS